ncbi:MAG: cyclophilin-like fold protein [Bacteroidales bacterium]|nr:cyclophilin-like fold protein [Bacteroidales bacterium]
MTMIISASGKTITATLADNVAAKALAAKLKSGSVTVEMRANGFEHYGPLGFSLERQDRQVTAVSGDIMLYNGNNICVFYGNNSWSYTPLGKVDGKSSDELKAFFGTGTVSVTYSLKQ